MKKFFSAVITLVMIFSLVGCGSEKAETSSDGAITIKMGHVLNERTAGQRPGTGRGPAAGHR